MGSRAVILVCRDDSVASERFRIEGDGRRAHPYRAVVLLRRRDGGGVPGRHAFGDRRDGPVGRARRRVGPAGRRDHAVVAEGRGAAAHAVRRGRRGGERGADARVATAAARWSAGSTSRDVLARARTQRADIDGFIAAYRRYCWSVTGLDDLRVAPFQVLAAGSAVLLEREHPWHMGWPSGSRPPRPGSSSRHATWWSTSPIPSRRPRRSPGGRRSPPTAARGWSSSPSLPWCAGRAVPRNPASRSAVASICGSSTGPTTPPPSTCSGCASAVSAGSGRSRLREFALGVEALERVARGEPLHRVHECVFGVLALESEPVDPRL